MHLPASAFSFPVHLHRSLNQSAQVLDVDNVFDLSYLVAGWIAIGRQLWTQSLENNFMALYCGMSWLRVLWTLRGAL